MARMKTRQTSWKKGVFVALLLVLLAAVFIPRAERKLLSSASCFAFWPVLPGPKRDLRETIQSFKEIREPAFSGGLLERPIAPFIIVTRAGGDYTTNADVYVASRAKGQWTISYALQQEPNSVFAKISDHYFDGEKSAQIERLISKKCLFKEPQDVEITPTVWLSALRRSSYYDGGVRLVEINDGHQSREFLLPSSRFGISGMITSVISN